MTWSSGHRSVVSNRNQWKLLELCFTLLQVRRPQVATTNQQRGQKQDHLHNTDLHHRESGGIRSPDRQISGKCRRYFVVIKIFFSIYLSIARSFPKKNSHLYIVIKSPELGSFWRRVLEMQTPKLFTSTFEYDTLLNTSQSLVKFRSVIFVWMKKMWKLSEGVGHNAVLALRCLGVKVHLILKLCI